MLLLRPGAERSTRASANHDETAYLRVCAPDCRCWRQHFGDQIGEFVLQSIAHTWSVSHTAPAEMIVRV